MVSTPGVDMLGYAPLSGAEKAGVDRLPVAPRSAERFQMLMFAPSSANATSLSPASAAGDGLRHHIEALSRRWEAGQSALNRMSEAGEFTSKELIQTQIQMINCELDVEVSSKCASMFESGVQTLVQRGS
jgi:hypothetical protein